MLTFETLNFSDSEVYCRGAVFSLPANDSLLESFSSAKVLVGWVGSTHQLIGDVS